MTVRLHSPISISCLLLLYIATANALDVKICVPYSEGTSTFLTKCTEAVALANTDELSFECVSGGSADTCIQMIADGEAHLTSLDGSDVIRANKEGLQPLVRETADGDTGQGEYYAVAVVNKDFCYPGVTMKDLEGTRSCHTGFRKSAGWRIPVGSLLINVQEFSMVIPTKPDIEDDAELVDLFFSEVCAPRTVGNGPANGPNQEGQKWDNLCTACKGDCSSNDQYYDYSGAFRCLVEGRGDVAFVKHTTVLDYSTEGTVDEVFRVWADNKPEEYRLLCPTGGCKPVTDYEDCHLAVAPSHALVTTPKLGAGGEDEETGLAIRDAILNATANSDFLEETKALVQGFLWTEGTTGLIPVENGIEGYLPEDSRQVFQVFELLVEESREAKNMTAIYCAVSDEEVAFCREMLKIARGLSSSVEWGCRQVASYDKCFEDIAIGVADWTTAGPREAFSAHYTHDLVPIVAEKGALDDGYDYYSIAVVKDEFCQDNEDARLIDLKGKNSCHTGYRRNAGWDVPIGRMVSLGIMEPIKLNASIANDAETVANFFNKICAPNEEGSGPVVDEDGSVSEWEPLCTGCKDSCDEDSPYFSYEGAHKCLSEGAGDVAFVKHDTPTAFDTDEELTKLRLLCPFKSGCSSIADYRNCNLGKVPARSVLVRNSPGYTKSFKEILLNLVDDEDFADLVLREDNNPDEHVFRPSAKFGLVDLVNGTKEFFNDTYASYEAVSDLDFPGGDVVKICVPYESTRAKIVECEIIFAQTNFSDVVFQCVPGGSAEACMRMIYDGEAHLTSLDGGDVFRGNKLFGLVPLLKEARGDGDDGTYYAVAVVNANFCSNSTTLQDLEGRRSCHTGYRKIDGWRIPVSTLLTEVDAFNSTAKLDDVEDDAELVAAFFNTTCAPRLSGQGPKTAANGAAELWEELCDGCKGDCSVKDQYYDYEGAFRCLVEGKGDVAFLKHTTVPDYADGGAKNSALTVWSKKNQSEYRLLCKTGGCAAVEDYEDCNLALVPSQAIVGAASLGEDGALAGVGKAIQAGMVEASKTDFFQKAKNLISDFPFSADAEGLIAVEGGYEGYITDEADEALQVFEELIERERVGDTGNQATFCAYTPDQLTACKKTLSVLSEVNNGLEWDCKEEESIEDCYESLKSGTSQFMAASPREVLDSSEVYGTRAIVAEAVGEDEDTVVYSLLVIDEEDCTDKIYISDLKDKRVCFPGYGEDAGWNTPIALMIAQGILSKPESSEESSNAAQSVVDLFSEVCAPHDPESEGASESLCTACEDDCEVDGKYSGPIGAVQCLRDGQNSLAVTDSTLLMDVSASKGLKLLCPYKRNCYDLDTYRSCNFGDTPTDMIIVSEDVEPALLVDLQNALVAASKMDGYVSLLETTRGSGQLAALVGSITLFFSDYQFTQETLLNFEG